MRPELSTIFYGVIQARSIVTAPLFFGAIAMKSLPTPLTTSQLEKILATLATMPSATVNRHPDIITVTATRKATGETVKVLSAATRCGSRWHVMTVPGLVSTTFAA